MGDGSSKRAGAPEDPGLVTDAPLYGACHDRGCLCGGQEAVQVVA